MKNLIIYKSRPFYLWFVAVILASVFVPFIAKIEIDFSYILLALLIMYSVAFFSIKSFSFYNDSFCKKYPFRFIFRQTIYTYSMLRVVEIRQRKEPYQRPYVILHFLGKGNLRSRLFSHRAFIFNSVEELLPLINHLILNEVPIKLNMTHEYKQSYLILKKFISNNKGTLYG